MTAAGTLLIISALRSAAPLDELKNERAAAPAHPRTRRQPPPL